MESLRELKIFGCHCSVSSPPSLLFSKKGEIRRRLKIFHSHHQKLLSPRSFETRTSFHHHPIFHCYFRAAAVASVVAKSKHYVPWLRFFIHFCVLNNFLYGRMNWWKFLMCRVDKGKEMTTPSVNERMRAYWLIKKQFSRLESLHKCFSFMFGLWYHSELRVESFQLSLESAQNQFLMLFFFLLMPHTSFSFKGRFFFFPWWSIFIFLAFSWDCKENSKKNMMVVYDSTILNKNTVDDDYQSRLH